MLLICIFFFNFQPPHKFSPILQLRTLKLGKVHELVIESVLRGRIGTRQSNSRVNRNLNN